MNETEKTTLALRALKRHETAYGRKIPPRLETFWRTGEAFKFEGKCLTEDKIRDLEMTWEVRAAVPSWEVLGQSGGIDIGIEGPEGEWAEAGDFVPLFHTDDHFFFMAGIKDPQCPVYYFEEELFSDPPIRVAKSLDAFLKMLGEGQVEYRPEPEEVESIWEGAADDLDIAEEETGKESDEPLAARMFGASIDRHLGSADEDEASEDDESDDDESEDEAEEDDVGPVPLGRAGFTAQLSPSPQLARVIGPAKVTRTDAVKQVWAYISDHKLKSKEGKDIRCDPNLKALVGKDVVGMMELPTIIACHLK